MVNKCTLIGFLGQDPEIRTLENGTAVGRFSLATSESWKDKDGEWQNATEWHNIVVWRDLAERATKYLKKGSLVYVEGKISHRKYTDKDGVEKNITDIVASTFRALEKRDSSERYSAAFPTDEPANVTTRQAETSGPINTNIQPNHDFKPQTGSGEDPLPF